MRRHLALILGVVGFTPAASRAVELPSLSLEDALRSAGIPTIPAAWSGIWATADTTYDCGNPTVTGTQADFDTLCTGAPIINDDGGLGFICSGTVDDVSVNVTCTASFEVSPGCTADISGQIVGTRNGESAFVTQTATTTFTPTNCAFQPDTCEITEMTMTRIAPEPASCSAPVEPSSWGEVKAYYR
jgi:hypothetical protein